MSELTPCNRCSLNRMIREAEKRGATVTVTVARTGALKGWSHAVASDRDGLGSWYQEISEGCVC